MNIIEIGLAIAAAYSAVAWLFLAVKSFRTRVDYETETFHLGLCFVLAAGFLGLLLK